MSLAHTVDGRTQFLSSPPKRAKMWRATEYAVRHGLAEERLPSPKATFLCLRCDEVLLGRIARPAPCAQARTPTECVD